MGCQRLRDASETATANLAGDGPRGLVCMSATSMDQTHPDKAAIGQLGRGIGTAARPASPPRTGLWRAVAGMAVALAIAAGIVAVDLSHELVNRVSNYRSRIASLNQRVDRLKQKAVRDEQRLADARAEIKERKLMESKRSHQGDPHRARPQADEATARRLLARLPPRR